MRAKLLDALHYAIAAAIVLLWIVGYALLFAVLLVLGPVAIIAGALFTARR